MKQTGLKQRISTALETLEALYFFTQSLEGQASRDISDIRRNIERLPRTAKLSMLDSIESDIRLLRDHYGAIANNLKFRELYARANAEKLIYLPKGWIERFLFASYTLVYSRWPYMTLHAYVPFDGANKKRLNWVFELEANHATDATSHVKQAQSIYSTLNSGAELSREIRQSYRTAVNACDLPLVFSPGIMRLPPVLGSPTLHLQSHSHQRKKRLRPAEPCERSRTEPRSSAQTPLV